MNAAEANKLLDRVAYLKVKCNHNPEPTEELIRLAWDIRKQIVDFAESVQPDIFSELANPNAVEKDGFPDTGNKVYHPIVDKCFHKLILAPRYKLYVTNLAAELRQIIESRL
jgi:hypothetical protein